VLAASLRLARHRSGRGPGPGWGGADDRSVFRLLLPRWPPRPPWPARAPARATSPA